MPMATSVAAIKQAFSLNVTASDVGLIVKPDFEIDPIFFSFSQQ
ncbi:hypothetical protein [Paenibacillus polymyxa]|nr:hypothetical protein [Paenibacillus polymyxa]MDQ0047643.1 hypothetical protein [Paenibacillus polymyxa]UZP70527.1 hypothetical protein MF622_06295 [Paenibacillus polymyxa]